MNERHKNDGRNEPCLNAVEGGESKVTGKLERAFLKACEKLWNRERDRWAPVEKLAAANEYENQRDVERVAQGFEKVEDGLVELESISYDKAQQ